MKNGKIKLFNKKKAVLLRQPLLFFCYLERIQISDAAMGIQ